MLGGGEMEDEQLLLHVLANVGVYERIGLLKMSKNRTENQSRSFVLLIILVKREPSFFA